MTEKNERQKERTDNFIEKYLVMGKPEKGISFFGMMADSKGTSQKNVAYRIRKMSYQDFMHTIYWQLVAWQVKRNHGWKCSVTGKKGYLEVHHGDYKMHGFEMFHLDKLICVSHETHNKIHQRGTK